MAFQVPRRNKKRLSQEQVRVLETSFDHDMKLEPSRKIELARDLGLHPRQVAVWYQNKRARWKTKSLEHDYKALRLRLESFLKEKIQLEKEVESLRREVEKARELLRLKSLPFSNDQWNSALLTDVNSCWGGADLRVDELYGCLAGRQQMDQEIEWL